MAEIEESIKNVELHGFPIVISKESQYLFGYIEKRDLKLAFGNYVNEPKNCLKIHYSKFCLKI